MKCDAKVMKRTSNLHDSILGTDKAETTNIFDDAAAFDTAVNMFNPNAHGRKQVIEGFLRRCQLAAFGFFERREAFHVFEGKSQKAQVLQQPTAAWQWIRILISDAFVMHTTRIGIG